MQKRPYKPLTVDQFPIDKAKALGAYMEYAPHRPTIDLERSYQYLKIDLWDQFEWLLDMGWRIKFVDYDPYDSYEEMRRKAWHTRYLKVWNGGEPNDYLAERAPNGETYNNIFRAVHDCLGHMCWDNNFTPLGEENAVRGHMAFCHKPAFDALILETRAQNAWIAYGPHRWTQEPDKPVILPDFPENKVTHIPELLKNW